MARRDPQFNVRIPAELKQAIEEAAKENNRSINSEIVYRLQQSFEVNGNQNIKNTTYVIEWQNQMQKAAIDQLVVFNDVLDLVGDKSISQEEKKEKAKLFEEKRMQIVERAEFLRKTYDMIFGSDSKED